MCCDVFIRKMMRLRSFARGLKTWSPLNRGETLGSFILQAVDLQPRLTQTDRRQDAARLITLPMRTYRTFIFYLSNKLKD